MFKLLKTSCLLLLALLLPLKGETLTASQLSGVEYSIEHFTPSVPRHGPLRLRVNLKNNTKLPKVIEFALGKQKKAVELAPLQSTGCTVDFFVTELSRAGYGHGYGYSPGGTNKLEVKVEQQEDIANLALFNEEKTMLDLSGKFNAQSGGNDTFVSTSGNVDELMPDDWRFLLGYGKILIDRELWQKLAGTQRQALLDFAKAGGILIYASSQAQPLQEFSELAAKHAQLQSAPFSDMQKNARFKVQQLGLGYIVACDGGSLVSCFVTNNTDDMAFTTWLQPAALLQEIHQSPLKVTRKNTLPLSMAAVMCLFAVAVGPLNLKYLAKSGQRQRLFITIPLISLAACGLMLVVTLFSEGLNGEGRRFNYIQLDNKNHNMLMSQQQDSNTGMLISRSFANEQKIFACSYFNNDGGIRKRGQQISDYSELGIDLSNDGTRFSGKWFSNRSNQQHHLVGSQSTRAALSLQGNAQNPQVVSSFDKNLQCVYVFCNKQWYVCRDIEPGQTRALSPQHPDWQQLLHEWPDLLKNRMLENFTAPREGFFVAISDNLPVISSLESLDWQNYVILSGQLAN